MPRFSFDSAPVFGNRIYRRPLRSPLFEWLHRSESRVRSGRHRFENTRGRLALSRSKDHTTRHQDRGASAGTARNHSGTRRVRRELHKGSDLELPPLWLARAEVVSCPVLRPGERIRTALLADTACANKGVRELVAGHVSVSRPSSVTNVALRSVDRLVSGRSYGCCLRVARGSLLRVVP